MICIPILSRDTRDALEKISRAESMADVLEVRLDVMESFHLERIIQGTSKPVLVTYRSESDGGEGSADNKEKMNYLLQAIEAGAEYVDVEYNMPLEYRREVIHRKGNSEIILSTHIQHGTPSSEELEDILSRMISSGPDIVKLVTRASIVEDNLRTLNLIPIANRLGVKIIAFCMGPLGRISRLGCILLGGYLTFASMEKGEESASGQLTAQEMSVMINLMTQ